MEFLHQQGYFRQVPMMTRAGRAEGSAYHGAENAYSTSMVGITSARSPC